MQKSSARYLGKAMHTTSPTKMLLIGLDHPNCLKPKTPSPAK